jgi:hypothetical protein
MGPDFKFSQNCCSLVFIEFLSEIFKIIHRFYCFETNALCGCREPAILEEDEEMEKQQQQQQQPANSNPAPLDTDSAPIHSSEDRQQQLGSIPESGEEKGMQETEGEKEEEEEERLTPPLPKENKV